MAENSNRYGLKETHGEEKVLFSDSYPETTYNYVSLYIAMGDVLNSGSTHLYTIKSISCTTKPISPLP